MLKLIPFLEDPPLHVFYLKEHSFKNIQLNFEVRIFKNRKVLNIYMKKRFFNFFVIFHCLSMIKN